MMEHFIDYFLQQISESTEFGQTTNELVGEIPYTVGQFWTSRQRQGHSIHEISYRGCFKSELPEFFINRLSTIGEAVYDPFAGRGTTLISAALAGRRPMGNDINPLSAMLCRPRLRPIDLAAVQERLKTARSSERVPETLPEDDLLVFFNPDTLTEIHNLRNYLLRRASEGVLDEVDDWIRMVALNRLTGHSSGYLSVYTLPPNQAASVRSQRKINLDRNQVPEYRNLAKLIMKKSRSLLRDGSPSECDPIFSTDLAWNAQNIPDGSVSLVVTSPPFLDVIHYDKDNWLRCWFAGIDVQSVQISQLKDVADWQAMIRTVLEDLARKVRPGGHVAFEVGEVRGGKLLLEQLVWQAAEGLPFCRMAVVVNGGNFTKTAKIWNVGNNQKGTNTNRIVMLRRK